MSMENIWEYNEGRWDIDFSCENCKHCKREDGYFACMRHEGKPTDKRAMCWEWSGQENFPRMCVNKVTTKGIKVSNGEKKDVVIDEGDTVYMVGMKVEKNDIVFTIWNRECIIDIARNAFYECFNVEERPF